MKAILLNILGGLGLFLVAMQMMTDGLRAFAAGELRRFLRNWSGSRWRSVATGALITALVQSSGAVTVAVIGFVNAGILSLSQALGIVFGANIGTTVTAWLVAAAGFDWSISRLALPFVAAGAALRLMVDDERWRGLATALVGFGLFFLGLAFLKQGFGEIQAGIGLADLRLGGAGGILAMLLAGFAVTVLMQSSSASIALIITATSAGVVTLPLAAAAVIGANVGTTSTAALAAIGATPSARRVAAGHIIFNLMTGIMALALLPLMLWAVRRTEDALGLGASPAIALALFHTAFNVLGVALLLPFLDCLAQILGRLFHRTEEDLSRPHYLDRTLLATASLALSALFMELTRMRGIAADLALSALHGPARSVRTLLDRARAVESLGDTIREYALKVSTGTMGHAEAQRIAGILRIVRYLEEGSRLGPRAFSLRRQVSQLSEGRARRALEAAMVSASGVLEVVAAYQEGEEEGIVALRRRLAEFEAAYQSAKEALLEAGAAHRLKISELDRLLDDLSRTRRMVEQFAKSVLAEARLKENGNRTSARAAAREEEAAVSQARREARAARR